MTSTSLPRIPLEPSWVDAIGRRASRRRFDGRPVSPEALAGIEAVSRSVREAAQPVARAVLLVAAPEGLFKGLVGSYGKAVRGAPACMAFIGRGDWHLDLGFAGQAVVLAATAAGLDTCWIAGSFDADAAAADIELSDGEQVGAVSPLGYGTARVGAVSACSRQ